MGKVEKQATVWQSNSMGAFDGLKLKLNNFVIDQTINYLGHNFSKQKLINLAKIFEKISGSKGGITLVECNGFLRQNMLTFFGGKRF